MGPKKKTKIKYFTKVKFQDLLCFQVIFGKYIWQLNPWGLLTNFPQGFGKPTFGNCKISRIKGSGNPHFLGISSLTSQHRI